MLTQHKSAYVIGGMGVPRPLIVRARARRQGSVSALFVHVHVGLGKLENSPL